MSLAGPTFLAPDLGCPGALNHPTLSFGISEKWWYVIRDTKFGHPRSIQSWEQVGEGCSMAPVPESLIVFTGQLPKLPPAHIQALPNSCDYCFCIGVLYPRQEPKAAVCHVRTIKALAWMGQQDYFWGGVGDARALCPFLCHVFLFPGGHVQNPP